MGEIDPRVVMRSCIQKVATGSELSKDLSFGEAHAAMACILDKKVDAVQAGVLGVSPSLPIRQNWPGGFHFCPQSQYEQYDKALSSGRATDIVLEEFGSIIRLYKDCWRLCGFLSPTRQDS